MEKKASFTQIPLRTKIITQLQASNPEFVYFSTSAKTEQKRLAAKLKKRRQHTKQMTWWHEIACRTKQKLLIHQISKIIVQQYM
jgi:hypothetical protein